MTDALARLEEANRMLAEARDLPELRNIRDLSEAALAWARAHDLGMEAENNALTIRLTAERRIGELLIKARADGTRARSGKESHKMTLADLSITKQQSSQWQALAEMPEDRFNLELDSGPKVSPTRVYKTARVMARPVPPPVAIADQRYERIVGDYHDLEIPDASVALAFIQPPIEMEAAASIELARWVATVLTDTGLAALTPEPTHVGPYVIDWTTSLELRTVAVTINQRHWSLILLFGGKTPDTSTPLDWEQSDALDQLIALTTKPGDTVLDVFAQAKVAQAVIRNDRSYVGVFDDEFEMRTADNAVAPLLMPHG